MEAISPKMLRKAQRLIAVHGIHPPFKMPQPEDLVDSDKKKDSAHIPQTALRQGKGQPQIGRASGLAKEVNHEMNSVVISGPAPRQEMSLVQEARKMCETLSQTVTENGKSVNPSLQIATPLNRLFKSKGYWSLPRMALATCVLPIIITSIPPMMSMCPGT
jgi:hypothetical protein